LIGLSPYTVEGGFDLSDVIRVLIVDDSNLFREALANFVAELEGILVVGRVRDGVEALEAVTDLRPDVILMDLMMPRLDGIEATRSVKRSPHAPAVVMCTTDDDERLREAALAVGADAFVLKRDLGVEVESLIHTLAAPRARARRRA
jgi:DNA-binding NarL/FixJ family response regulator